jgi:hypothetical protein
MRNLYEGLKIDGVPILTPDQDVEMEYNDLDSEETGRDESGVMHRIVLRNGVRKISLPYESLTKEEYLYMRNLFAGKSEFTVTLKEHNGEMVDFIAYHSKHSITIHNAKTGIYKNYKISIIEC